MKRFENKNIVVAITGGIAAYKACDVVRRLYREGAKQVVAIMTPGAKAFISPLTLESLTRHKVYVDDMENTVEGIPTHVTLAQTMDAMMVLPCTANTLAKLAHGMADNMVTTTAITFTGKPVVIVPAMNTRMWENPLVQNNLNTLQQLQNVTIVPPVQGELACGEIGDGKLADEDTIMSYLYQAMHPYRGLLTGKHILVTAGGTREPLDAVRYLTNRGSGKMGLALADELFAMGAEVTLIHTLAGLNRPYTTQAVETVEDMDAWVTGLFPKMDGLFMAAAVSDFRPVEVTDQKIKKQNALTLNLVKTQDILEQVAQLKQSHQFVVGFAAESNDMMHYAQEKLTRKCLDMIVANDISRDDIGFAVDENEVTLLFPNGRTQLLHKAPKFWIARQLVHHFFETQNKLSLEQQKVTY